GTVLVAGGRIGLNLDGSTSSAELYDADSGTWSETGRMLSARDGQTATLLNDGKVLVAGGSGQAGLNALSSAELYDPVSGTWTATRNMVDPGRGHTATLLSDGRVLVVGGDGDPRAAELYDPVSATWTATTRYPNYLGGHTATLLSDGRLLRGGCPAIRPRAWWYTCARS